jgi:co-chaperonin GroES (HSP10)
MQRRTPDPLKPPLSTELPEPVQGNLSGWRPLECKVLVLPDTPRALTATGIHIPNATVDREWHAQHLGTLVAVGGLAFQDWPESDRPRPGDRIHLNRYQGQVIEGADGRKYRLMNDVDILAVADETDVQALADLAAAVEGMKASGAKPARRAQKGAA